MESSLIFGVYFYLRNHHEDICNGIVDYQQSRKTLLIPFTFSTKYNLLWTWVITSFLEYVGTTLGFVLKLTFINIVYKTLILKLKFCLIFAIQKMQSIKYILKLE